MPEAPTIYVHKNAQGGWQIVGSRVSLDSVVSAYWEGKSAEAIIAEFPTLSAEQVYGAIAFYQHHQQEIDEYLSHQGSKWQELARRSNSQHGPLLNRVRQGGHSRDDE